MSYFATIAGIEPPTRLERGRLTPLSASQCYTQTLTPYIEAEDGIPAYLWDDEETNTSNEIICDAEGEIQSGVDPAETDLGKILLLCSTAKATFRVWWAGRPGAHEELRQTGNIEEALEVVAEQAIAGSIGFVYKPSRNESVT
jgi:hypothetical protein